MADRVLRGSRLGAVSYETDRNHDLAPRQVARYRTENGEEFDVPFADDAGFAPDFDTTTNPEFFIFTHRRTAAAAADAKTAIQVEYGSALAGWTTAVAGEDVIIDVTTGGFGPGVDRVDVKIRRTLALDDRLFARLKVAIAP